MGRLLNTDGGFVVGGRLKPNLVDPRTMVPVLDIVMVGGRAVMKVTGIESTDEMPIGKYLSASGLVDHPDDATNIRGEGGSSGLSAWTPLLSPEQDGVRTVLKVSDWVGGSGTKPGTGYLSSSGIVAAKANAFNFNTAKKFGIFSASTGANGVATVPFGANTFPASPAIGYWAIPTIAVGSLRVAPVAGSLSATQVQIKVEAPGLVTGLFAVLTGATVFVLAIES